MKKSESQSTGDTKTIPKTIVHYGIDELNLAEFPLASIAERRLDGKKTIFFEEPLFDRNEGKTVVRRLTISGSDKYGLPTALDDDVLLACMQLSKMQDFQSSTVTFSRYEILKMLGMRDTSPNYARVATSLRRWKGVTIFSDRAFYDHLKMAWINKDFGIFDTLYIYSRQADGPSNEASSRFTWNEVIFSSFRAGYLKRLDWKLYTELKNPLSKRMYRFLDKRFYHSHSFQMDLWDFGVNRMGLSPKYNSTQMKRALSKGLTELELRWDLKPLDSNRRYLNHGRGNWQIRFERKGKSSLQTKTGDQTMAVVTKPKIDSPQLQSQLVKRGIGPAMAEELCEKFPLTTAKTMVELFDWYNQRGQPRGAGFLVQAIRKSDTIELPKGFESSQQLQNRRESAANQLKHQQSNATRRQRMAAQRDQTRFDAFADHWQSLSQDDQTKFEDEALAQAEPTKRMGYYRHQGREGQLFEEYRQVILRDYFELGRSSPAATSK